MFVTKEKQSSLPQYTDYIIDEFLYWEGEKKGKNNHRLKNAEINKDVIHLFYRGKHHQPFKYLGLAKLVDILKADRLPFRFLFKVLGNEQTEINDVVIDQSLVKDKKETQRRSLILSRIGQGQFREDLFDLWQCCAVTEIKIPELLIASHIKPWKDSDNTERLDPYNGLLLSPIFDALFDKGLISFEDDGKIIISRYIADLCDILNLNSSIKLREVHDKNKGYLDYHRTNILVR